MQAYLIMAHNNFYVLEFLLKMIDYEKNDIFIHIDKKVISFDMSYFEKLLKYSKIIWVDRIDVTWGEESQVECEMILMKAALKYGKYDYVHLISGSDLPLKSAIEIYSFFEKQNGKIFFQIDSADEIQKELWKISEYHVEKKEKVLPFLLCLKQLIVVKLLHYNRLKQYNNLVVKKGANWFSMPGKCVEYLVAREKFIKRLTNHTVCGDEFFAPTVLANSKYWKDIYSEKDIYGHMRYINWEKGNGNSPKVLTIDDYEELTHCNLMWARKFDENVDKEIVKMIYDFVMNKGSL